MDYRNEYVHPQASASQSLLEKYSEHDSTFPIIDHCLMKLEETYAAAALPEPCDKATTCQMSVQVKKLEQPPLQRVPSLLKKQVS